MNRATPETAARGFSLVEILVAMAILAISLGGLAALLVEYARRVRTSGARSAQMAIVTAQTQRLTVLPFDSLATQTGCTTFSSSVLPHTRCIVLSDVNARRKRVMIIITPADAAIKPDTIVIDRIKQPPNPLNLP